MANFCLQDNEGLLQGQDWAILENFSLTEEDLFPGSLFPEYTSTPDSTLMSAPAPDDLTVPSYPPNNDSLVFSVIGNDLSTALAPPKDQRGKHVRVNKLDVKPLEEHIESFHPVISHYRREHAPFRRYLPSDITIKLMHSDFTEKGNTCSYETYRRVVKSKNISFAKLGEEECESCLQHKEHCKEDHTGETATNCESCQRWQKHIASARESRAEYRVDAERDVPHDTSIRSVDMQKVIMLPRMPGVKSAVFTKRIVAYHETFATVGNKATKKRNISVVWHEGVAGRSAKEVTSAYMAALQKE
ncbi:hypothetical protein SKAU_G00059720 [Synaphobranchus kaupii]|uniref:Uncharacterized protein n=1 Tax=Synaphobranchus kaupii TaxID=118154 RepID=A0A9Q1JAM5_SYNKA|nr:hypothetical protein SKAU_G00059720 [Synaphobranchus kaupii]